MSNVNKKSIDKAIRHTGLVVHAKRGDGYSYFLSRKTDTQIGESQMVCYLNHRTLAQWVQAAEEAAASDLVEGMQLGHSAVKAHL